MHLVKVQWFVAPFSRPCSPHTEQAIEGPKRMRSRKGRSVATSSRCGSADSHAAAARKRCRRDAPGTATDSCICAITPSAVTERRKGVLEWIMWVDEDEEEDEEEEEEEEDVEEG